MCTAIASEAFRKTVASITSMWTQSHTALCVSLNGPNNTAGDAAHHPCSVRLAPCRNNRLISTRHMLCLASKHYDVDIAVVGGGPGGLAAAAAITSAFGDDQTVKVYESLKQYTVQGSGVLMMPNVQNALEAIHPSLFERFKANGMPSGGSSIYDTKGKHIMTLPPNETGNINFLSEKYGKSPFFLGWHEIRQLLFEFLPKGVVQFDKQMKHYEEHDEGVTLHFDHGQPSVRAKLLVGADGYFSKIRSQCLDDGPPTFVGTVMWRARIGWQEGMQDPVTGPSRIYSEPGPTSIKKQIAIVFKMGTLEETKDKAWTWVLSAPVDVVKAAGVDFDPDARSIKSVQGDAGGANSALENAIKVFANFSDALMDIVKGTDPLTVTQHGLYMRPLADNPLLQHQPTTPHHSPPQGNDTLQPATPPPHETQQPQGGREQVPEDGIHKQPQTSSQAVTPERLGEQSQSHMQDYQQQQQQQAGSYQEASDTPQAHAESDPGQEAGWGRGRVTLLGDAAHATIPNGQGLSLAVEDAVVLAWHLKQQGLGESALRRYEQEQLKRVKVIHVKGTDSATPEDRERYIFKPTFKSLWRKKLVQEELQTETCIVDFEE